MHTIVAAHFTYKQGIFNNNRAMCLTLVFAFDLSTFSLAEYFKPWIRLDVIDDVTFSGHLNF